MSVSGIVGEIENGEEVGKEEEKKLRGEIEKVILEDKLEGEWTVGEGEMMAAYLEGVRQGWFKEGDLTRVAVDFDLETVKFNEYKEEKKIAKIEERKKDAGEKLVKREVIESQEEITENFRELQGTLKNQIAEESEAYEKLVETRSAENLFSKEGRNEMIGIINSLKKSNQIELDLERLEYYHLASSDEHLKFLIEEHHTEKDYTIRMLEEALAGYDKILEILEKEERELTEEEKTMLGRISQWMKENPRYTILGLLAILAAAGLIITYGPGLLAGMGGEKAVEEIGIEVAKQVAEGETAKKIGLAGIGAAVGGAGLLGAALYKLSQIKEDDVRRFMEKVCGVSIPQMKTTTTTAKS